MDSNQKVIQSQVKQDRISEFKTIYDVSKKEVFLRNIVAGAGRTVGSMLIYLVFIIIIGNILAQLVWPQVKPFVDEYRQLIRIFSQQDKPSTTQTVDEASLQQLLRQLR